MKRFQIQKSLVLWLSVRAIRFSAGLDFNSAARRRATDLILNGLVNVGAVRQDSWRKIPDFTH